MYPLLKGVLSANFMQQPKKKASKVRNTRKTTRARENKEGREKLETQVYALAEPLAQARGLELVAVEYVKEAQNWVLRIFIDRPEGIDLEICQEISRHLGKLLDADDLITRNYFLEVSSPGLERPLKKEADFQRYQGHKIRVSTYASIAGKKVFTGVLQGLEDNQVLLEEEKGPIAIPFNQLASARLMAEF